MKEPFAGVTSATAFRLGLRGQFRDSSLEDVLQRMGLSVTRVFAPNLSTVSESHLHNVYNERAAKALLGRSLTRAEVSAALGHRRMMRHFMNTQAPWGLFFEDDAEPTPDLVEFIRSLETVREPTLIDLCPWESPELMGRQETCAASPRQDLYLRRFPSFISCGYAVNRPAVQALTSSSRRHRVCYPADWEPRWLDRSSFFETGTALVVHPPVGVNSMIDSERAAICTSHPLDRARSLPLGRDFVSLVKKTGIVSIARFMLGAPFRFALMLDRGQIYR